MTGSNRLQSHALSARFRWGAFLLAFVFGLALNELNLRYIKSHNPANAPLNNFSTIHGFTVWSIDNAWYLPQVDHFLKGRGFTIDPDDPRMAVRRSPGYPLFYGLHRVLFGERGSFLVIRYSQLALNALASVLLGLSVLDLTGRARAAKLTTCLYALNPYTAGYCYYTVTEGLSPALTAVSLYCFARAMRLGGGWRWLLVGSSAAAAALTRPVCGLLLPTFVLALAAEVRGRAALATAARNGGLVLVGFLLLLVPWAIRNYRVTGDVVLLEKYYDDPMGYGTGEIAFRSWWSGWENPRAEEYANAVLRAGQAGRPEEAEAIVQQFVRDLPARARHGAGTDELRGALGRLNRCLLSRDAACDHAVAAEFLGLAARFRRAAPLRYWVLTPLRTLASLVFQSFSSSLAMLNPPGRRFGPLQVAAKAVMYALNLALWAGAVLFALVSAAPRPLKVVVTVFPWALAFFFVVMVRYIEARYLLPAYPLCYVALGHLLAGVRPRPVP